MSLRPFLSRARAPVVAGACYFASAGAAIASTRYGGGVACLWAATAVLWATLSNTPRGRWPATIAACAVANIVATGLWGLGWAAAVPMAAVNMAEAVLMTVLIGRWQVRNLDSLERLLVFCLAGGVVAPFLAGLLGAAVAEAASGTSYAANLRNWYVGHALGTISFAPVFNLLANGSATRWVKRSSPAKMAEAVLMLLVVAGVTGAVFGQQTRPLLFLPILPVILATFRIGRLGAAASVVIVAVIGGWLTARGSGPINLFPGDPASHAQAFQFYLAATVLTALPVAADLARRREMFQRMRDSEAQLRLLTDHSTDIVLNLKPDGTIRYASRSIAQLGGFAPEAVVGRNALALVLAEDRAAVRAAHRAAVAAPDTTQIVEYRARARDGSIRWFEIHSRGVRDEDGHVTGVVSAVRDVSHRKAIEAELVQAAATDPLTGLANRRAFDAELARRLAARAPGHLAIFDLDHFKRVNDVHGHAAGDEVLRAFARIARALVRDGDLVARLGGEEFGILLGASAPEQARIICDRIRAALAEAPLGTGKAAVRVTASAGVAPLAVGSSAATAMEAADAALYRAKTEGRDRLRLAA